MAGVENHLHQSFWKALLPSNKKAKKERERKLGKAQHHPATSAREGTPPEPRVSDPGVEICA